MGGRFSKPSTTKTHQPAALDTFQKDLLVMMSRNVSGFGPSAESADVLLKSQMEHCAGQKAGLERATVEGEQTYALLDESEECKASLERTYKTVKHFATPEVDD